MSCTVLERRAVERPSADVLVVTSDPTTEAHAVPWSTLVLVAMTGAVAWWAAEHAATLRAATSVLTGLDLGWFLLAASAASATWVFSGVSQQGALAGHLPFGSLVATQFAGTFANTFTPAGLGGGAVNVRFLRRRGITSGEAIAAVGLTQIAGVAVHLSLLAAVLLADPSLTANIPASHVPIWLRIVVAAVVGSASVVVATRRHWVVERLHALARQTVSAVAHLRRPRRLAELLGGSLGLTAAHVLVLFGTLRAPRHPAVADRGRRRLPAGHDRRSRPPHPRRHRQPRRLPRPLPVRVRRDLGDGDRRGPGLPAAHVLAGARPVGRDPQPARPPRHRLTATTTTAEKPAAPELSPPAAPATVAGVRPAGRLPRA